MGYLRGFIPWIAAGFVSGFVDWRWGAVSGFASGLLLLLQDRRRGVGLDALILEAGTIAYFAWVGAVAVARPHSFLSHHTDVLSFAWLAATAWGTLAIRRPFTLGIAKRQMPREVWDMPEFVRVNNHITSAWGTGFTFIGVSLPSRARWMPLPGWASPPMSWASSAPPSSPRSTPPASRRACRPPRRRSRPYRSSPEQQSVQEECVRRQGGIPRPRRTAGAGGVTTATGRSSAREPQPTRVGIPFF
ncbi:hypothetical protein ACFY2Z_34495 [Streptomyces sp. NPDC001222]|uniref:hypothetical protein n=1 Tax=Streptomyces sp. NPDC001222 TaxID=3364548 RepID=UPI0036C5C995